MIIEYFGTSPHLIGLSVCHCATGLRGVSSISDQCFSSSPLSKILVGLLPGHYNSYRKSSDVVCLVAYIKCIQINNTVLLSGELGVAAILRIL